MPEGQSLTCRFAYLGIPHTGGTHTVYQSLRLGLKHLGVCVRWLGLGPQAQAAFDDPRWATEREHGVVIAGDTLDDHRQASALVRYLESSDFGGVFVNVLSDRVGTNATRFLNPLIRRVMIVHSISPGTYAAARVIRDHMHATVGVSPRIRSDLIGKYGFAAARTHCIPTAVEITAFRRARVPLPSAEPLRVLFLGRVKDTDKGVFWLPEIMSRISPDVARLTVVGDGPDLPELKRRCAAMGDRVWFAERVPTSDVPAIVSRHDLLLFPSRFEGQGLSLVEAMAGGCVPIATRIKGVTDFVVRDGETGVLFEMGNVREAARAVGALAKDRARLQAMSKAAEQGVQGRFDLPEMASAYSSVIKAVHDAPTNLAPTLPINKWRYPTGLCPGLRTYLPSGIKNALRAARERFA